MGYVDEKLCLIDMDGAIVVEPSESYDIIYFPSNGLCLVERDGLFGYINTDGEVVIPVQYERAYEFSDNGLAFVALDDGPGGYINVSGEVVIDAIYESGSMFAFGLAAVLRDERYVFINKKGEKVIDYEFEYASGYASCGLAKVVRADGRHQLIDVHGKVKLTLKAGCELDAFIYRANVTSFAVDGKRALVNADGEIITELFDDLIVAPGSGLNPFLKNGLWGYLNDLGEVVIPNVYLDVSLFSDYGIAQVRSFNPLADDQEVTLYINTQDMIVERRLVEAFHHSFSDRFGHVYPFHDGLALARKKSEIADDEQSLGIGKLEKDWMDDWDEDEENEYPETTKNELVRSSLYLIKVMFKQMKLPEILSLVSREFDYDILITTLEDHYIEFAYTVESGSDLDELRAFMDDILTGVDAYCHFRQLV